MSNAKKPGRPPIRRRRAHIRHAMATNGVSGTELHGFLEEHGYIVSLSTVYNWMAETGPGPDAEAVELIAKAVGRKPAALYRGAKWKPYPITRRKS